MTDAAELYSLTMLAWILGGCAVALLLGLGALLWQEMRADSVKHPFNDDIPHWW